MIRGFLRIQTETLKNYLFPKVPCPTYVHKLNFVFYDTETSGLNKMFGQIFQFATVLTDENFA